MNFETISLGQSRGLRSFDPAALLLTVLLGLVACAVLYPIFLLVVASLQVETGDHGSAYSLGAWKAALSEPGIVQAFLNTLIVTGLVQGISIPVAILIAWVIARTDMPGASFAELLFWVTFFIPTLAVTAGWILVLDPKFAWVYFRARLSASTPSGASFSRTSLR